MMYICKAFFKSFSEDKIAISVENYPVAYSSIYRKLSVILNQVYIAKLLLAKQM